MKTSAEPQCRTTVAATVAGEDVSCGDYLTLLSTMCEMPSLMWDDAMLPPNELVRLRVVPADAGVPLKVFSICLPFVYAKTAAREVRTLDLRRQQVARLDPAAAKEVWGALKQKTV
jgi:hypothetical protein